MESHLTEVGVALAIAGILALFRIAFVVQRLDQAVRGLDGKNGLVGRVEEFRRWRHEEAIPQQQFNELRFFRLEEHSGLEPMQRPSKA